MTILPSVPATPEMSVEILREPRVEQRPDRMVVVISVGALTYIAASAYLFSVNWMLGILVVLAAGIVSVLIADRAVCASFAVDDDADAIERMLLEDEKR